MQNIDNLFVLCTSGSGYLGSSVLVTFSHEYNMKIHPSIHKNIDDVWQTNLQLCSNLFNGTKFRLHEAKLMPVENSSLPTLCLSIGLTSYKDFIGTNRAPYASELYQEGIKDHQNSQAYMADPIGVGGLLISSDEDIIFMKRSKNCAEMQLLIDRPGGHPEPDVVKIENEIELQEFDGCKITKEIFDSVLKEIRDEINIPLKFLSSPILLGIGYNPHSWRRPSFEFLVRCSLKTSDIQNLYEEQTQAESEESTELIIVPLNDILEGDLKQFKLYNELTQPAQCALHFLRVFMLK